MPCRFFINAAGAYSDRVAKFFGVGVGYRLVPFKGVYRRLKPELGEFVRGNIYPVPDARTPFLGVHFTRSVHGDIFLGPTAIPALGRENYGMLRGADAESLSILALEARLFLRNPEFRAIAFHEPRKYIFRYFFNDARRLVKKLDPEGVISSSKVGIRPQLVDLRTGRLVMDFLLENADRSVHVLNAISPAFTSSMAFAPLVVNRMDI